MMTEHNTRRLTWALILSCLVLFWGAVGWAIANG